MKRLSLLLLSLLCLLPACSRQAAPVEEPAEERIDTLRATILFAGDLMQHDGQIKNALQRGGGTAYDYADCFALVAEQIQAATLAVGNLEVTLGGAPYKGYPCFSAPDEYLDAIQKAGFGCLLTANNHCLDRRAKGLERTIDLLDARGIPHLGTYKTPADREKSYPLLLDVGGIRVCLLAFTYGTNGIPNQAPNVVNLIDREQIKADIEKARAMQPDVIIACPHWGIEYVTKENAEQRALAEWLLDQGVDHVIGGHPHVVQPFRVEPRADGLPHVVAYSLGNFISNMTKQHTVGGYMLTLSFEKICTPTPSTTLTDCTPTLYYVSRPSQNASHAFRVVPETVPDSLLSPTERTQRQAYFNDARRVLGI